MSIEKMYKFRVSFGRHGTIEGVFVATPEDVADALGVTVDFYEPWGKHSSATHTLSAEDFTVLTEDQDFIAKARQYGISHHGENPIGLIADMRMDGRLPSKEST